MKARAAEANGVSSGWRCHVDLIGLNVVLAAIISAIVGVTLSLYGNRLGSHPEWVSSKTQLERGVMGAVAFTQQQQPLARNRLNLGAWHGHQEIVYSESLDLIELSLSYMLAPQAYLSVIYDRRPGGFSGVRVSDNDLFPSILFGADPQGAFLTADTLTSITTEPGIWNRLGLSFYTDWVEVRLNGTIVAKSPRSGGKQQIALRGGYHESWVDNIDMVEVGGRAQRETFSSFGLFWPGAWVTFAGLLSLMAAAASVLRRVFRAPARPIGLGIAAVCIVLIPTAASAYVIQYVTAGYHPLLSDATQQVEAYWIRNTRDEIMNELHASYGSPPLPGEYRVLFLGSSQTWGAGARTEDETWVRELERLLNKDGGPVRYSCINAGVMGFVSGQVLSLLEEELLTFEPRAAVVNLSNNDLDPEGLRLNLRGIVRVLLDNGVRPVLLAEPNSVERRASDSRHGDINVKHSVVREVAGEFNVRFIDVHGHLAGHRNAGFLWWDFSHLTSFGQRLMAAWLHPRLLEEWTAEPGTS